MEITRILHVVGIMNRAGAETLIMNLYRTIDRSRLQFDFLCVLPEKGDFEDEIAALGGRVFHLATPQLKIPLLHYFSKISFYRALFRSHPEYHTVHFHNSHACSVVIQLYGASLGGVTNKIVHSHNTNAPHRLLHLLLRPFIGWFNIHRLACSAEAAGWMFGKNKCKATTIKNGINMERYAFSQSERNRLRKELGLNDKKVVLHAGRFNRQKNHAYLLQIFKEMADRDPAVHLLLAGTGELLDETRSAIGRYGLNERVSLLGLREDIPSLLSAADLFLFPSLYEGLSVALVEAQANGIPVLTTTNLSPETVFSSNFQQLSTSLPPAQWADEGLRLIEASRQGDRSVDIKTTGFDIAEVAQTLTRFYSELQPKR